MENATILSPEASLTLVYSLSNQPGYPPFTMKKISEFRENRQVLLSMIKTVKWYPMSTKFNQLIEYKVYVQPYNLACFWELKVFSASRFLDHFLSFRGDKQSKIGLNKKYRRSNSPSSSIYWAHAAAFASPPTLIL